MVCDAILQLFWGFLRIFVAGSRVFQAIFGFLISGGTLSLSSFLGFLMSSSEGKKPVSMPEVVPMMSKIMEDKLIGPNYLDWSAPLCIFWTLWMERNRVVFENEVPSAHRMKSFFLFSLWSWAKLYSVDNLNLLVGFLTWMGYR